VPENADWKLRCFKVFPESGYIFTETNAVREWKQTHRKSASKPKVGTWNLKEF